MIRLRWSVRTLLVFVALAAFATPVVKFIVLDIRRSREIRVPDMIDVEVKSALPGRPITGERLVRPDGTISMGYYGDIYVAGSTPREAKAKIAVYLRKYLSDEALGLVKFAQDADGRRVFVHKIEPDETDCVSVWSESKNAPGGAIDLVIEAIHRLLW